MSNKALIDRLNTLATWLDQESQKFEDMSLHHDAEDVREAIAALEAQEWVSVEERLPTSGVKVIARYKNGMGKERRVMAEYIAQYSIEQDGDSDSIDPDYCEERDIYYWPAGWYERIENWDDLTHITIDYPVEDWKPLPEPPEGE